jgi:hypothetical protein
MDIICPGCREQLKELGSWGEFFKCMNEDIVWILRQDRYGRYLRTLHTPYGYEGPMFARVDEIEAKKDGVDEK